MILIILGALSIGYAGVNKGTENLLHAPNRIPEKIDDGMVY